MWSQSLNPVQSPEKQKKQLPEEEEYVFPEFPNSWLYWKAAVENVMESYVKRFSKTMNPKPWPQLAEF